MTKYRFLALDLDGTLLGRDLKINDRDREAIFEARQAGVAVTLATGRMFQAALPFARELEIDVPLVTYTGAYIRHPVTNEVLNHRPVPLDVAMDIIDVIGRQGFHINIYLNDELYIERRTRESEIYYETVRVEPRIIGPLVHFLDHVREEPTKILVIGEEERLDLLAAEIRPIFQDKLHITKSKPHFLEFSHPLATKANALDALARTFGIGREEVLAVGDNYNDLEMIEYAGLGVIMGSAREDVKARADYVTASQPECGVARAIEKFILSDK